MKTSTSKGQAVGGTIKYSLDKTSTPKSGKPSTDKSSANKYSLANCSK